MFVECTCWRQHRPNKTRFPFTALQVKFDTGRTEACSEAGFGQLYTRYHAYQGYCAIMYMWYFPMDKASGASSGLSTVAGIFHKDGEDLKGHRHDFESVIVWATSCKASTAEMYALSYSAHGGFASYLVDLKTDLDVIDGGNGSYYPEVTYAYHDDGISTHYVDRNYQTDDQISNAAPTEMIEWSKLPAPAKTSFLTYDWGSATCMMCDDGADGRFIDSLDRAWRGYKDNEGKGLEALIASG